MKLYHGTTVKIEKELRPHKAFETNYYKPWVHLSKNKTIATLYAVNPIRAFYNDDNNELGIPAFGAHFQHNIENERPIGVYEIYKGFFEELFNRKAYLYVADVCEEDFDKENGFEVMVAKNVPIQSVIPIENVYKTFKELAKDGIIEIIKYEDLPYDYLFDNVSTKVNQTKTQYEANFHLKKFPQYKKDLPEKFRKNNL